MNDELGDVDYSPDEDPDRTSAEVIGATEGGVRVLWVTGATMQDLLLASRSCSTRTGVDPVVWTHFGACASSCSS